MEQNTSFAQKFRNYLVINALIKSQNANMGINFFMDNPGAAWQDFLNMVQKTPCENIKAQREYGFPKQNNRSTGKNRSKERDRIHPEEQCQY
ncbi:hypothetical protein [Epilithonimonas tenax]|uniref:hypothetical protein n=1 Tax=Epilithonimonas tenax TaxID=191577 RepID=UPI00041F5AD1|nr:hypothetical protein [Epilithonimonas tenax]